MINTPPSVDKILSMLKTPSNTDDKRSATDPLSDRIAEYDIIIQEHAIFLANKMILYHHFLCQSSG